MQIARALALVCSLASLTVAGAAAQAVEEPSPVQAEDPVSDFGFWPGEWLIENTRYDAESEAFVSAGVARSSAEMLLDGRLLLERWEGEEGLMEPFFGLTLRYFEPSRGRWVTIKNWPAGSPLTAQFSRVEGSFVDGVIVLHPARVYLGNFETEQFLSTRSVVGEVSADSFRVQLQRPVLASRWAVSWAMDYLRVAEAEPGPLRIEAVPEAPAAGAAESRLTDWLIGEWASEGVEVRVSSAFRGLGFVASVAVDLPAMRASSVLVGVWDANTGTWQAREVGLNEPLRSLAWETVGRVRPNAIVLRSKGTDESGSMVFRRLEGDGMRFELTLPDGERLDVELAKQ